MPQLNRLCAGKRHSLCVEPPWRWCPREKALVLRRSQPHLRANFSLVSQAVRPIASYFCTTVRSADVQTFKHEPPLPIAASSVSDLRWTPSQALGGSVKSSSSRANKRVWNGQASQLPTFSTVKCPEQNARPFVHEQLSSAELHKLYSLAITGNLLGSSSVLLIKKKM